MLKTEILNGKRYVCIDDLEKLFDKEEGKFLKLEFTNILKRISNNYSSINAFADNAGVDRGYMSRNINSKLDNPPSPKILRKIAKASKGITTYKELMQVCGYLDGIDE